MLSLVKGRKYERHRAARDTRAAGQWGYPPPKGLDEKSISIIYRDVKCEGREGIRPTYEPKKKKKGKET